MFPAHSNYRARLKAVVNDIGRWFFSESLLLWAAANNAESHGYLFLRDFFYFVLWISATGVLFIKLYPIIENRRLLISGWIIASLIIAYISFAHGSPMPQLLTGKFRFVLPAIFTMFTLYAWYRAFHPVPAAADVKINTGDPAPATTTATTTPAGGHGSHPSPRVEASPEVLPGFSIHFRMRIHSVRDVRRKYIFDFGRSDRERLSLYVSADDILTLSFVDAKGEPHPLQMPLGGSNGFPIDRFTYFVGEVGVGGDRTIIRMEANGRQIASSNLPFKTDLGSLDFRTGVLGGDLNESNCAAFDVAEWIVYPRTLSGDELNELRDYSTTNNIEKYVEFGGNQCMRRDPIDGHLKQPNDAKGPRWRDLTQQRTSGPSSQPQSQPQTRP